jgi:hypothetical protein
MPWVRVADLLPQEDAQVLVHDGRKEKIELGRYVKGRWYVEDPADGRLAEVSGVTHWAPVLDSYLEDESDDD